MEKEKNQSYDYIRLGKRIQARRKEIGLTQEELAEKIECSLTHLSRLESGSPPGLETLIRLSYLLGYSLDEMVGLYPSPSPFVHEICDLFLVHSEEEQQYALWLLQYFFYILDEKELNFRLRKRRTKTPAPTSKKLADLLPYSNPKELISQFEQSFPIISQETKNHRRKKETIQNASSKTSYSTPELPTILVAESPGTFTAETSDSIAQTEPPTSPLY